MKFSNYILKKAKENGVCPPGAEKIVAANSIDELLQIYVESIDFCLDNNFPSNSDLIDLAGDLINQYGIYVDSFKKLIDRRFVVALGNSKIEYTSTNATVGEVFVKHDSSLKVYAKDNSFVVIDCFDQAQVSVKSDRNAKVLVNVYGNSSVDFEGEGIVKVVRKYKKSY